MNTCYQCSKKLTKDDADGLCPSCWESMADEENRYHQQHREDVQRTQQGMDQAERAATCSAINRRNRR